MSCSQPGLLLAILLSSTLPGFAPCQEPVAESKPETQPQDPESSQQKQKAIQAMVAALKEQGVDLDLENRRVTVSAEVGRPTDPLEYLLITPKGKDHESLLVTQVQPSLLNAAFLALGLEKGTNASTRDLDPQPTEEEIRAGAPWFEVIPPEGHKLYFTVSWVVESEDGEPEEKSAPIEDWILDFSTEEPIRDCQWIYLGGRMGPLNRGEAAVFLADYTGDLISVCYRDPANHLVTARHAKANNDDIWWLTRAVPEPGTAVKMRIDLTETPLHRARRERIEREDREKADEAGAGESEAPAQGSGGEGSGREGGGK